MDYPVVVVGDWRVISKNGEPVKYDPSKGEEIIRISGGNGLWYYQEGDYRRAVEEWVRELEIVEDIECRKAHRFHKGYYYQMIYAALSGIILLKDPHSLVTVEAKKTALVWLKMAYEEDKLTYGEEAAKSFPAWGELERLELEKEVENGKLD